MENDDLTPGREVPIRVLLARAVQRARGSLFWERLWPALATFAMAVGLFLTFSWAGLWLVLPPLGARHRAFDLRPDRHRRRGAADPAAAAEHS